jgi:ribokinase
VRAAAVTLVQLEVPLEAVAAAARTAGGLVVLNPAPVRALPEELLGQVDVLVPNRVELAQLAAGPVPATVGQAAGLADALVGGATLEDAARWAVRVAAAACLRPGAQVSLPTPAELRSLPEP